MKPGDFSKYAATKEANPFSSVAQNFLKGIGRFGGASAGHSLTAGTRMAKAFGGRAARNAGNAAGWAMANPGTTAALGAGGLFLGSRFLGGSQQQPQYRMY